MTSARRTVAVLGCAFLILVVTAVMAPRWARACDPAPASEQGYVDGADVAFDGTAVASTAGDPNTTYQFRVDNWVKPTSGTSPQNVATPKNSAAGGVSFDIGRSYRVYAKKQSDGTLLTTMCSGDHPTNQSPPLSTTTTARTSTSSAATATTSRSTSTVATLAPTTTPPTFLLAPTTEFPFTTPTAGNNVAIKEEKPARTNRLVIGLILGAAVAAIGAGVVLWRRGP